MQHDLSTKAHTHRHETCTVRGSRRNSLSTRAACCAVPCCTGPRPSQPATTSPHMTLSSRTLLFVSLAHLTYWFCSSLSTCLHQGQGHCKRATPVRLSRSVPFRSVPFRSCSECLVVLYCARYARHGKLGWRGVRVSPEVQTLIRGLMEPDPNKRMGCRKLGSRSKKTRPSRSSWPAHTRRQSISTLDAARPFAEHTTQQVRGVCALDASHSRS